MSLDLINQANLLIEKTMNKDITLEEYTNKFNRIFADKKGKEFTQEELTPLWQSLQNDDDDMDITFDDEIRLEKFKEIK